MGTSCTASRSFLQAGVMAEGASATNTSGDTARWRRFPPAGHLVLRPLDWRWEALGDRCVRDADDCVVAGQDHASSGKGAACCDGVPEEDLGLMLNPEKTQLITFGQGFDCPRRRMSRPAPSGGVGKAAARCQEEEQGGHQTQSYPRCRRGHAGNRVIRGTVRSCCHRLYDLFGPVQGTGPLDQEAYPVYAG